MHTVKVIGMIFLAVYLILSGLGMIFEITPAGMIKYIIELLAVSSGILILLSVGRCQHHEQ